MLGFCCHEQNRLDLGKIHFIYCHLKWSWMVRNKVKNWNPFTSSFSTLLPPPYHSSGARVGMGLWEVHDSFSLPLPPFTFSPAPVQGPPWVQTEICFTVVSPGPEGEPLPWHLNHTATNWLHNQDSQGCKIHLESWATVTCNLSRSDVAISVGQMWPISIPLSVSMLKEGTLS